MAGDEVGAFGRRDVLTVDEMPRHTHSPDNPNGKKFNMSASGDYRVDDGTVAYTDGAWSNWVQNLIYYTGGDKPHNNVPPYIAAYVWKCTSGGASRSEGGAS